MGAPAGWYDDGSGRERWWDGEAWQQLFRDKSTELATATSSAAVVPKQSTFAGFGRAAISHVQEMMISSSIDTSTDPDTIWSAVGKPLTGMGIGRYRLTSEWLYFEKGTLSNRGGQVRTHELFDVDVSQSIGQKSRGLGTIRVQVVRDDQTREMLLLEDISNFREGVVAINDAARDARLRLDLRHVHRERALSEQVQSISYPTGAPVGTSVFVGQSNPYGQAAPVTAVAAAQQQNDSVLDLNAAIGQLVAYRDSGALTEEEFVQAKKKLLGL